MRPEEAAPSHAKKMREIGIKLLNDIANEYEEKGYNWLYGASYPITFSLTQEGTIFQFEVDVLEKNSEYVHAVAMVSFDRKTDFSPLSEGILAYRDK